VVQILLCESCKFGEKICYSNWDNIFFLRDCFLLVHPVDLITSLRCCASYTGCLSRDEWNSRSCLVHQSLVSLAPTYLTADIHLVSEYGHRLLRSSMDRTLNGSANPQQIWWSKLCCCRTSSMEKFVYYSASYH